MMIRWPYLFWTKKQMGETRKPTNRTKKLADFQDFSEGR